MQRQRLAVAATGLAAIAAGAALLRTRAYAAAKATFADRTVVITGGGRGLGFVLARELTSAGARVALLGRDPATLERARASLAHAGLPVFVRACDVRDAGEVERAIAAIVDRLGTIDVLINDAGVIEVGAVWDQSLGDFRESLETHVYGPLHTMRAVLPAMRARGEGRIANIASIGGRIGVPHLAPYAAGKFGLVGLSQAFAAEVAADGISITTVCPGLMRTGSPDMATFKGRHRAEYAWFTISDATPLLSTSAYAAARAIVFALARRRRWLTLTLPARIAEIANGVAPGAVTHALGAAARLLPPPLDRPEQRALGAESHSPLAPSVLTALDRLAKRRTNEP